jgi:hypothetical protein
LGGVFAKNTSLETKFGLGNFSSLDWYFSQIPLPNMIYLFNIVVGDSVIKRGRVAISLTGLTLSHFCACPKPGPGFPMSYVVVF